MKKTERTPDSEERTHAHDLTDICSEIFTLILQLRRTSDFGNFEILRQRVRGLLSRVEAKAKEAGTSTEDIQLVLFACIAFLDETIIASDWAQKDEWLARPLQLEYFNRFDAGEEFFVKLDALRQRPQSMGQVLKVFHMCMSLGYRGKHQFLEREKIKTLIEETYAELYHYVCRTATALRKLERLRRHRRWPDLEPVHDPRPGPGAGAVVHAAAGRAARTAPIHAERGAVASADQEEPADAGDQPHHQDHHEQIKQVYL